MKLRNVQRSLIKVQTRMNRFSQLFAHIILSLLVMVCLLPHLAKADARGEELKRCLEDFGGIEWMLPYQPPVNVRSCASETMSYDIVKETVAGRHTIELITSLTLGMDRGKLTSDEMTAAVHNAAYVHFDALFRRYGYRQLELGHGDAQVRRDLRALMMLSGGTASEEAIKAFNLIEAKKPPIPYVNFARYEGIIAGQPMSLTYKLSLANAWRVILEPVHAGVSGTMGAAQ